jgi:hypothetical protein
MAAPSAQVAVPPMAPENFAGFIPSNLAVVEQVKTPKPGNAGNVLLTLLQQRTA